MSGAKVGEPPTAYGTYQSFVDYLKEPDSAASVLSPRRFSQALHIDLQTLAEQAHVHRNTITRAPGSRGIQNHLREALRLIKAATDLNGDLNKALCWYRNVPIPAFGYNTAEQLVSDGRTEDVLQFLASLDRWRPARQDDSGGRRRVTLSRVVDFSRGHDPTEWPELRQESITTSASCGSTVKHEWRLGSINSQGADGAALMAPATSHRPFAVHLTLPALPALQGCALCSSHLPSLSSATYATEPR
jgi:hypothetical protein